MLGDMQCLLVGDALSADSRQHLADWLRAGKMGAKRVPAGLPFDWRVGDKTGAGGNGTANDIAVAWLPGRAPILFAVYFTGSTISDDARSAVIAYAGRIAVASL
jgi:beta-lactamase class A